MIKHYRGSQLFIKSSGCLLLDIPYKKRLASALREICEANIEYDIPQEMREDFAAFINKVTSIKDGEHNSISLTLESFSPEELDRTGEDLLDFMRRFYAITGL